MGYEVLLCIPLFIFLSSVVLHYTQKLKNKIIIMTITVIFLFIFCFVIPGPLGIKKTFPFVYWSGGQRGRIYYNFKDFFKGILESLGFQFI